MLTQQFGYANAVAFDLRGIWNNSHFIHKVVAAARRIFPMSALSGAQLMEAKAG